MYITGFLQDSLPKVLHHQMFYLCALVEIEQLVPLVRNPYGPSISHNKLHNYKIYNITFR